MLSTLSRCLSNPLDPGFRSFENNVLPVANQRGIAVLGMKSMGGSGRRNHLEGRIHPLPKRALLRHEPATSPTTISGIDSMEVLDQKF